MGTPCRCLELGEWVGPLLLRSREPDPSLKLADDSGNATFLGPSRAPLFPWHRLGSPHPFTRGLSAFDHPQALHVLGAHSPSWTPTSCACSSLHLHMPHLPEDHLPFPTTLHLHNLRPFIHCLLLLCPSHSRSTLRTEGPRARYSSPPACTLSPALLLGPLLVTAWNWVVKRGTPKPPRAVGLPVRSPTHHTSPASSWEPRGAPLPLRGVPPHS